MNQIKIGSFIKELRKEKQLTQEQFANIMEVSNRSVSRWENGVNMPDLDILINIADYFEVTLEEIFDGERKCEKMNKELEETVRKVADYSNEEKGRFTRVMHYLFLFSSILMLIYSVLEFSNVQSNPVVDFIEGYAVGFSFGALIVGVIFTSRHLKKIKGFKLKLLKKLSTSRVKL